jgi:acetylornithine deacetylase/succinyl-diaminopimelate desuccinylase-like protein
MMTGKWGALRAILFVGFFNNMQIKEDAMLQSALEYSRSRHDAFLKDYIEILSIPSVSTLPEHAGDVSRVAEWLASALRGLGMTRVDVIPTALHPIIYAERIFDPSKPVILVYGHYDVQPVDPIEEWLSDPFKPETRGENLYARGASDMKGSMVAFLKALESLKENGGIPINVKFLLEGEEEIGSPNLPEFITANRELLRADVAVNCDGAIYAPDRPSISYGLRGLAYFEIEVRGPSRDLHSGVFGGSVLNPVQALCELIAGMHDADGRVTLPGFYDRVLALTPEERALLAEAPHSDEDWKAMAGVRELWGEKGFSTVERVGSRPTFEVNGIYGGFTGAGAKTVLPAKATAKVSARLVADQDASAVCEQIREYMRLNAPSAIDWEVRELSHGYGALMRTDSAPMLAAVKALDETFGAKTFFKREGGSVPVVSMMQQELGVDTIMLGFALPDDGIHGPNEKQHLPTFFKGIEAYIRFLTNLVLD